MNLIKGFLIFVLLIIAIISFYQGNYFSCFVQITPPLVSFFSVKYPDSRIIKILLGPLAPIPRSGLLQSEFTAQMAYFSSKCAFLLLLIWSTAFTFNIDVDSSQIYLGMFAFALPLLIAMSIFATIFQTLKFAYIKISGRDGVWVEDDT